MKNGNSMKNVMKIVVCALTAMALAETLCAATYYYKWTGAAGDGLWTTPGNWTDENGDEPNQAYPQTSSTDVVVVLFDKTTPMEVTVDADVAVWSVGLKYGAGPLTLKGEHTLKLRSNYNEGYQAPHNRAICNENAGTLNTNGTITFECPLDVSVSGAYLDAGIVFKGNVSFSAANGSYHLKTPDSIVPGGLCETLVLGVLTNNASSAKFIIYSNNVFHVDGQADVRISGRFDFAGDAKLVVDGGTFTVERMLRTDGWVDKNYRTTIVINDGTVIETGKDTVFPLSNANNRGLCPCDFKMAGGYLRSGALDGSARPGGHLRVFGSGTVEITGGTIDFDDRYLSVEDPDAECPPSFKMSGGKLILYALGASGSDLSPSRNNWFADGNFQLTGGEFIVRKTALSSETFGISDVVNSVTNANVTVGTTNTTFTLGTSFQGKTVRGTVVLGSNLSIDSSLSSEGSTLFENATLKAAKGDIPSVNPFNFAGTLTLDLRDYLDHETPHTITMNNANPIGDDAVILVKSGTTLRRDGATTKPLTKTIKLEEGAKLFLTKRDWLTLTDVIKPEAGSIVEVQTTSSADLTTATAAHLALLKAISGSGATLVVSKNGGAGKIVVPSKADQYITFSNCCVYASVFEQGKQSLTFGPEVVVGAEGDLVKNVNNTGYPIVINQSVVFDSNSYSNSSVGATVDFSTTKFVNPDASKKAIIRIRGKGEVKLPAAVYTSGDFEVLIEGQDVPVALPLAKVREALDKDGELTTGGLAAKLAEQAANSLENYKNIALGIEKDESGSYKSPYLKALNGAGEDDNLTFQVGGVNPMTTDEVNITYSIESSVTHDFSTPTIEAENVAIQKSATASLPTRDKGEGAVKYYRVRNFKVTNNE